MKTISSATKCSLFCFGFDYTDHKAVPGLLASNKMRQSVMKTHSILAIWTVMGNYCTYHNFNLCFSFMFPHTQSCPDQYVFAFGSETRPVRSFFGSESGVSTC